MIVFCFIAEIIPIPIPKMVDIMSAISEISKVAGNFIAMILEMEVPSTMLYPKSPFQYIAKPSKILNIDWII